MRVCQKHGIAGCPAGCLYPKFEKKEEKGFLDSFFDTAESIVDGAVKVFADVPDPDTGETLGEVKRETSVKNERYIEAKSYEEEAKEGGKKKPREVLLAFRNISLRRDGRVVIIAEMETHEVVAVVVSEEDYRKMVEAAEWLE